MSVWTQVSGFIQVRDITEEEIKEKLGTPISYEDMYYDLDKSNPIPCGSEGSLKYHINPIRLSRICGPTHEIRVYGSLRDYSNYGEILDWVQRLQNINEEDGYDDCIVYAEMELSIGEPAHQFVYNGYETDGNWWDTYRVIPQEQYEELTNQQKTPTMG